MELATWILVIFLSVTLFIFLIVAIVLAVKMIKLVGEANKIVQTSQSIASKADDIVDNVKGMTSVGGIVKTFANRIISEQERRYAEEDAAREAAEEMVAKDIEDAIKATKADEKTAKTSKKEK